MSSIFSSKGGPRGVDLRGGSAIGLGLVTGKVIVLDLEEHPEILLVRKVELRQIINLLSGTCIISHASSLLQDQCTQLHEGNLIMFNIGLYLIPISTAGVKAGLPSHGADQFEDVGAKEKQHISTFFNWFLLVVCLGGAVSLPVFVFVEDNEIWDWGFSLSTVAMLFGIFLVHSGLPWYRIHVVDRFM